MYRKPRSEPGGNDRGSAMVEFAIIVPLLLLLVCGIVSFGVMFGQKQSLNSAVREGARAAVVRGETVNGVSLNSTEPGVDANVRATVGTLITNPEDVLITADPLFDTDDPGQSLCSGSFGNPNPGEYGNIEVKATYEVTPLFLSIIGIDESITMTSTAVFRCEFS